MAINAYIALAEGIVEDIFRDLDGRAVLPLIKKATRDEIKVTWAALILQRIEKTQDA